MALHGRYTFILIPNTLDYTIILVPEQHTFLQYTHMYMYMCDWIWIICTPAKYAFL